MPSVLICTYKAVSQLLKCPFLSFSTKINILQLSEETPIPGDSAYPNYIV